MAETAKLLAPDRTVLLPELKAGCSLAETVTAEDVRHWRAEHPGGRVVAYVNTSAAVKAESDICCTSSNAVEVVESLPGDEEILFLPDMFLGQHVARRTGRHIDIWMGECHVHAAISPVELREKIASHPRSELFIHPECGCTTSALWMAETGDFPKERTHILSTSGMVKAAQALGDGHALVATETGILHQLRNANPKATFEAVSPRAECRFMKMTTPQSLLRCLRDGTYVVEVEEEIAGRARQAVQRMISIGAPGGGE
jgi:quinolinate synthase